MAARDVVLEDALVCTFAIAECPSIFREKTLHYKKVTFFQENRSAQQGG